MIASRDECAPPIAVKSKGPGRALPGGKIAALRNPCQACRLKPCGNGPPSPYRTDGSAADLTDIQKAFGSLDLDRHAFFFDFDGTLAEIAPHPQDVILAANLPGLLDRLSLRTAGAVAVITGRDRAEIAPHLGQTIPVADFPGLTLAETSQSYRRNSPILETVQTDAHGNRLRIIDFLPRYHERGRIFRGRTLVRRRRWAAPRPRDLRR